MDQLLNEIELEQTLASIEFNETEVDFFEAFELYGTTALSIFLIEQNA